MGTYSSFSAKISQSVYLRYAFAVICALAASLICSGLERFLGNGGCYVLLLLAVAVTSWYAGVWPSIVAIVIGLAGAFFGFVPRVHAMHRPEAADAVAVLVFLLSSLIVILLGEFRRDENEALHRAQSELEVRVQQRTADLDSVNRSLRELSARLMKLQDEERRRIARELHDSVGQTLAALGMNLSMVRSDLERLSNITATLNDSEDLVRNMSAEVRTISHLLHPPLLDEAGLASALRWYADGFAKRSGIKVNLDLQEHLPRLPSEIETAIFRVIQECLTNIHRHSDSQVAKIQVRRREQQVFIEVADKGKGIPSDKLEEMATAGTPGVGIRGMRERLRQLGGTMDIESGGSGTCVTVQLPVPDNKQLKVPAEGPAAA